MALFAISGVWDGYPHSICRRRVSAVDIHTYPHTRTHIPTHPQTRKPADLWTFAPVQTPFESGKRLDSSSPGVVDVTVIAGLISATRARHIATLFLDGLIVTSLTVH